MDTVDTLGDRRLDPAPARPSPRIAHSLAVTCLNVVFARSGSIMTKNLRAGFFMLALMVVAAVALTNVLPLPSTPFFIIARALLAGSAVAVVWYFIFRKSDIMPPTATALGPPNPMSPSESEIADEYATILQSYDLKIVELFSNTLGNLPRYLTRIDEHIEILEETPQLCVTRRQTYQIDKEAPQVFLVPLALIQKGTLLDNFVVTGANGNEVSTLPYNRLRGLLAVTLEILVRTAMKEREAEDKSVAEEHRSLSPQVSETLRDLVISVCGPGPLDRLHKRSPYIAKTIEATLESINTLPISDQWKRDLRDFCKQYVDYYVVVAEVPRPETQSNYLEIVYSHRVPFEDIGGNKHNQWRQHFGLKPSVIDIPLNPYAFQVEAYHQEIDAEPGQYIFDHHLEKLKSRDHVTQDDLQRAVDFAPYVRLYHDEARPNTHLYVRRRLASQSSSAVQPSCSSVKTESEAAKQEETFLGPLKSVVKLREIPPGTLGAATIIAFASAMIISFFAITHIGLDINPNGKDAQAEQIKATLNSDVPALLLALPAFVGVLIGSWLDLSRLRRASLTTYLALAGTMFLSLASALYFVFDANVKLPTEVTIVTIGYMEIMTDWIWLVLMAVAITHFLFLFRTVTDESRHYADRIKKRIDKQLRSVYK